MISISKSIGSISLEIFREGERIQKIEQMNLITNEGINFKNEVNFLGVTAINEWRIAPIGGSPSFSPSASYTSRTGWTEAINYDEASRVIWNGVSTGNGVTSNAANPAEFTVSSGGATFGGMILVGGPNAATKGNTSGGNILMAIGALGQNLNLLSGDIIRVTWIQRDVN